MTAPDKSCHSPAVMLNRVRPNRPKTAAITRVKTLFSRRYLSDEFFMVMPR